MREFLDAVKEFKAALNHLEKNLRWLWVFLFLMMLIMLFIIVSEAWRRLP